jgi:hypothetical protein
VAAAVNVMPSTSVFAEGETLVTLEKSKVVMSAGPLGTVIGVQFVAVFQSLEPGLRSHESPTTAPATPSAKASTTAQHMQNCGKGSNRPTL